VRDRATREPARDETAAVARSCWQNGLVTITAGTFGNVIRTLTPLVASDAEIDEGLGVLGGALAAVSPRA
jgi:4-aminobutyrate aminotransferase/(S)-3-amino-2-methylpropionate transaminase